MRLVKALLPDYVSVDERSIKELKDFVLKFSKTLRYFNLDGSTPIKGENDWVDFFDKKINENQQTEPHYALFQAFLELFRIAQNDLNTLTKRHLDYFYQEVLQLRERDPVPDQVFMIFELARHVSESGHLIKKGTRLKAGKDSLGNNVFYTTSADLVVNKAAIKETKALFKDLTSGRLFSSPLAKSSDGQGGEFEGDVSSWLPFGNNERAATSIGFAFSSPILRLAEGTRKVIIKISFNGLENSSLAALPIDQLNKAFQVAFSGEKEWINPMSLESVATSSELQNIVDQKALQFINTCETPEQIAGVEPGRGPVHDAPGSGYGDQVKDYDIGKTVAEKIIALRKSLPDQKFTSMDELLAVRGFGEDKLNDLRFTFTFVDDFHTSFTLEDTGEGQELVLCIVRTLSKDQEAVVGYNQEALGDPLQTTLPTIRILLENTDQSDYLYEQLSGLHVKRAELSVEVHEVKNLIVQNDQTVMDPAKTILPFGIIPVSRGSFYIGSQEVFQKQLDDLSVNIEWSDLPEGTLGDYFKDYTDPENTKLRANDTFTASLSILDKKEWKQVAQNDRLLFTTDNTVDVSELGTVTLSGDSSLLQAIERDPELGELESLGTDTQKGFLRMQLNGQDFGHKDYQIAFSKSVIKNVGPPIRDPQIFPNEPYQPQISGISLDYKSTVIMGENSTNEEEQFFHLTPFGSSEQEIRTDEMTAPLFSQHPNEGELYIGIEKLAPPQNLSMLVQVSEGSENPRVQKPVINWAYLSNDEWIPFEQFDILSDSTNGLVTSGIINFSVSKNATSENTLLTNGLHWLRASVEKDTGAIPRFTEVLSQAVVASFQDNNNDLDFLAEALPAESIGKFEFSDSAINTISQPFASFGGEVKEQNQLFYRRTSERLRHKQRAITIWDYERLILQEFPSIYKVKCLNHTRFSGALDAQNQPTDFSEVAPGNVSVIIVSNVRNRNGVDLIRPLTSVNALDEISTFLQRLNGDPVTLHVKNPVYEEIKVDFKVKFREGFDLGFYKRQLEDEIKAFLSPWAYEDSPDIVFGGKLHQSRIIDFVDERPYVDYATCFKMYHPVGEAISQLAEATEEAVALTSASILCSIGSVGEYGDHTITVLEEEDDCDECTDNVVIASLPDLTEKTNENRYEDIPVEDPNDPEPYEFKRPDLSLCPPDTGQTDPCADEIPDPVDPVDPPGQVSDCILPGPGDANYFDFDGGKRTFKFVDVTYFIPVALDNGSFGVEVLSVNGSQVEIVGNYQDRRFNWIERLSDRDKDPVGYTIQGDGLPSDTDEGAIFTVNGGAPDIKAGDYVNILLRSTQYDRIRLPGVTEEMVTNEAKLRVQVVAGQGANVQIDPPEGNQNLFRSLDGRKLANFAMRGQGAVYSAEFQATRFDDVDPGLGWLKISDDNNLANYYPDALAKGFFDDKKDVSITDQGLLQLSSAVQAQAITEETPTEQVTTQNLAASAAIASFDESVEALEPPSGSSLDKSTLEDPTPEGATQESVSPDEATLREEATPEVREESGTKKEQQKPPAKKKGRAASGRASSGKSSTKKKTTSGKKTTKATDDKKESKSADTGEKKDTTAKKKTSRTASKKKQTKKGGKKKND
ncbi:MAG: baseplate J/gp47 family protein [Bacteroidota bacterium]